MITETHWLAEGQFLAQLEPFKTSGIPTNCILHKKVPGCGATTLELLFQRNSIIIEPNVPVIKGKCRKMNNGQRKNKVVMGVYENVTEADIKYYLENRKGYKKIMTTPESFQKVVEAIGLSIYIDYFLLFDECEKAIQDIDFRKDIINPIDAFFKFESKAFVSATPILPSDPRFNSFKLVNIQPDYDFKEPITVYTTNNVVWQLKTLLDQLNSDPNNDNRKYFIFFKSTKRIINIIKGLKLTDHAIYCSDNSAKEAKRNDIANAYDQVNNKFGKYSFLTSRFFSAVDIDYSLYQCDPIIIMLSDVKAVEHSVIDPDTEAIQIGGRFRKPDAVEGKPTIIVKKDIFHISNYNSTLTSFSESEVIAILEEKRKLHEYISRYKPTTDIEYIDKFIKEILTINGFSAYLMEDGRVNYFMVDNFKNQELVKGYYIDRGALIKKYKANEHFILTEPSTYYRYTLSDQQLLEITDKTGYETASQFVSEQVKLIMTSDLDSLWKDINLSYLRLSYPELVGVIDSYGLENAVALDFRIDRIKYEQKNAKGLEKLLPMLRYLKRTFEIGKGYSSGDIAILLSKGIEETGLKGFKPDLKLLRNGVRLSDRRNIRRKADGTWEKGYAVLGYLQNLTMDRN